MKRRAHETRVLYGYMVIGLVDMVPPPKPNHDVPQPPPIYVSLNGVSHGDRAQIRHGAMERCTPIRHAVSDSYASNGVECTVCVYTCVTSLTL